MCLLVGREFSLGVLDRDINRDRDINSISSVCIAYVCIAYICILYVPVGVEEGVGTERH